MAEHPAADAPPTPPPDPADQGPAAEPPVAAVIPEAAAAGPERVGVLVVHGIGEQRRFEHLEEQTKKIALAIIGRQDRTGKPTQFTFEIAAATGAATYQSEQDSWVGGRFPAVRALVRHGDNLEHETHLHFHEVWWADVNEAPTLCKQIRFWGWGLAMWSIPGRRNTNVAGEESIRLPVFPDTRRRRLTLYNRLQLFFAAWVFLLSSFSVTLAVFVLKRLNFGVWSPVKTFVNYLSGVKLYTQNSRAGGGTLDGIREPPRFAIRRRMVRAIVDVAGADYDRWYILAHSLGAVVAFNGLMTLGHSLPNYLDEQRWRRLCRKPGWVGPPRGDREALPPIDPDKPEIPRRPLWIGDEPVVVYRDRLFERLRGFLTYGSPLDKFAGMWPAYVPLNKDETVFRQGTLWINIFDRTDPVAAALKAYDGTVLSPINYGYAAYPVLLYSHLKYLELDDHPRYRGKQPADCVVDWLLLDRFAPPMTGEIDWTTRAQRCVLDGEAGWYERNSGTARRRFWLAFAQWVVIAVLLDYLGVWVLRWIIHLAGGRPKVPDCWPYRLTLGFLDLGQPCGEDCSGALATICALAPRWSDLAGLGLCGVAVTLTIGSMRYLGRRLWPSRDDDSSNW